MDHNCPDCNTELVRSAVGLLCPGCGAVHQFEKFADSDAASIAVHRSPLVTTSPAHDVVKPVKKHAKPTNAHHTKSKPPIEEHEVVVHRSDHQPKSARKYSLKHHMKRLLVPELPAAHVSDYSQLPATTSLPSNEPAMVTDISKRYDQEFVPEKISKTKVAAASAVTAAAMVGKHDNAPVVPPKLAQTTSPETKSEVAGSDHQDWKEEIDDTPASFNISRSVIMIVAAVLLLIAAYLAVFWLHVA